MHLSCREQVGWGLGNQIDMMDSSRKIEGINMFVVSLFTLEKNDLALSEEDSQ